MAAEGTIMNRRPGVTLMEVLVTIVIAGVGLLAVMTLVPLGAVYTASAVKEDRSHQLATFIDGFMRSYWKAKVVEKMGGGEPLFVALDNPDQPPPFGSPFGPPPPHGLPPATNDGVSYPVVVDPMGWYAPRGGGTANPTANRWWLGDSPTNIPRRSLLLFEPLLFGGPPPSGGGGPSHALRVFSLIDLLGYVDGVPTPDRELVYNAFCVVQRKNNRSNKYMADLTVVVFNRRAHLYAPAGVEETFFNVPFTPGQTGVIVNGTPDVKPGEWVMDASCGVPGRPLIRHANFYRVTSVTPQGADTVLEFETSIQPPTDNNTAAYAGTLVILRGVSGVYPREPLAPGMK
jgi:prepilin-type N-terminal cleavage/methylation domain-containing protein